MKRDYPDVAVYLFGSRAGEDYLTSSDYDLLVVSRKFGTLPFYSRMEKMYDYWNEPEDIEVFCYTPDELAKKKSQTGLERNALATGKKIV